MSVLRWAIPFPHSLFPCSPATCPSTCHRLFLPLTDTIGNLQQPNTMPWGCGQRTCKLCKDSPISPWSCVAVALSTLLGIPIWSFPTAVFQEEKEVFLCWTHSRRVTWLVTLFLAGPLRFRITWHFNNWIPVGYYIEQTSCYICTHNTADQLLGYIHFKVYWSTLKIHEALNKKKVQNRVHTNVK